MRLCTKDLSRVTGAESTSRSPPSSTWSCDSSEQKDASKTELRDFSNNNGYDINRNGDSVPLLLDVVEGFLEFENQSQGRDSGRRSVINSWGWWKVKKWTVHIVNRLYTRFGDLKLQIPENKAFAQHFQKNYAGKVLECHLNLLNAVRVGAYLPDRVTNLLLQYLSNSISKAATYNLLQARVDVVLFEIIFPLMCFNENDQKIWEEDPHEYVRKCYGWKYFW
ncbi:hypothetical protein L2E82_16667 [Cichorium intybus]|uniref:Uncharacterized protein n=1 Tax=Cichorium intybus TaxID=13427 RepID=A0ACB9F6T6_CICIN|nr:hypothetical protein L2E82_16667 [Cichorium intybus]